VGLAEHSEGKPLRIAGSAGTASAYFDGLTLSWSADRPEGRGPSGIGIRTGEASIVRNSLTDPVFEPWRDRARRFGIRSSVTVPFARGGVVLGAVIVYASEPDAFGPEELEVFQRLGDELALAMAMDADRKRLAESESARQASEARYGRLFNAAASGIVVLTPKGQYTHANPAMHRLLGYAPGEIVGLWATDLVAPDEHTRIGPALAEIEGGGPYDRVWRFRRKTGEILTAEVSATLLPDGNIIAIVRDITPQVRAERDRQAAEQALRQSEARYRSLFDNAPEGMVLISQDGPYLDVNPSACRMLGYARDDLIGKTGRDLVDEAQFHFLFEAAEEIARHGVARRRWRLKRGDGTWLAAEVVSTQLPDGPYMSVITDLTDRDAMEAARSAAETALRQSEARYRGLFDHAPDGIIVMSPEGVFLDVNASACEILGDRPDTLLSRTVRDIIAPDDEPHLEAGVQAIAAMGVHRRSGHLKRADGGFVAVEVITTRIPNGCYVSIIRDMSERDRIEAARSAAETALRQSEGRYRGLFDHAPD
jgi:PAS domain S-box-containing protein